MQTLFIAVGGAAGALLRYWMSSGIYVLLGRGFPYGTLTVNIVGSTLMGLLYVFLIERMDVNMEWRAGLIIGLLGAFTTFSTFAYENHVFLKAGDFGSFALYTIGSFVLGFLVVFLGIWMVKQF